MTNANIQENQSAATSPVQPDATPAPVKAPAETPAKVDPATPPVKS
jgi:hypothetical protein